MLLVFILWILPTLFIAGVILMVIGFGGVRRGQTAVCAKCGFELSGTSLDGVCPECGVSLSLRGSWRRGVLEKRPALGVLGLLLVLPFTARSAIWAVEEASPAALASYKPMWLLRSDIQSGTLSTRNIAVAEVQRRIAVPSFANWADVEPIVQDALKIQADPALLWNPNLGDLIVAAESAGHLSDEDYEKFIANSAIYDMKLPEYVQAGSEFEVQIDVHYARTSNRPMRVDTYVAIMVNEQARPLSWRTMAGSGSFRFRVRAPAETGVAEVKATLDFVQATVLVGSHLLTRSTNVIPSDQAPPIEGVADPSILAELQRRVAASLERAEVIAPQASYRTVTIHWTTPDAAVSNVDFAFRVMLRGKHASGDAFELDVGQLRRWQQDEAMAYVYSLQRFEEAGELRGATLQDVVLRVDRDGVSRTPGMLRPWTGEDVVLRTQK